MEVNKIYNCDCIDGLKQLDNDSVDLTVTSPPYDNLRSYGDTLEWGFEVFKPIAKELYRVTKPGGVVVWVVGDAVIKESETCSSFKQALYFVEECGFKLHDTMIYEKNGSSYPVKKTSKRYTQIFEYMFVFVKGKIRNDITLIADKKNKWAGWTSWGRNTKYDIQGNIVEDIPNKPISEFSLRNNIWKYSVSFNDKTGHPAVFPEKLAEDHILSWTREGDLVLDPFMGSGTTAKMALLNNRKYIGFEKNQEYYEKSLERVAKYEGKHNDCLSGTTITDVDGEEMELQVDVKNDNELEGKTKLWNQLVEELNTYFNEQTLGILKSLKLVFKSKSNDERVKKIHGVVDETNPEVVKSEIERLQTIYDGLVVKPSSYQPSAEVCKQIPATVESVSENNDNSLQIDITNNKTLTEHITEVIKDYLTEHYNEEQIENQLFKFLEKYYQLKRLPDAIIEVNERAREEKKKQEEQKNPIQFVVNSNEFITEKPKRKRRTKAEMEEARKKETEAKEIIIKDVHTDEDGVVQVDAQIVNTIDKIETEIELPKPEEYEPVTTTKFTVDFETPPEAVYSEEVTNEDELPFTFDSEEERQSIVGNSLGDIVDGKPIYMHTEEPVVKVKRPRGRPRKNPINN